MSLKIFSTAWVAQLKTFFLTPPTICRTTGTSTLASWASATSSNLLFPSAVVSGSISYNPSTGAIRVLKDGWYAFGAIQSVTMNLVNSNAFGLQINVSGPSGTGVGVFPFVRAGGSVNSNARLSAQGFDYFLANTDFFVNLYCEGAPRSITPDGQDRFYVHEIVGRN